MGVGLQFVQTTLQALGEAAAPWLQTHQHCVREIVVFDQLVGQPIEDERKLRWRNQGLIRHVC
jgi:hypothetical protein